MFLQAIKKDGYETDLTVNDVLNKPNRNLSTVVASLIDMLHSLNVLSDEDIHEILDWDYTVQSDEVE